MIKLNCARWPPASSKRTVWARTGRITGALQRRIGRFEQQTAALFLDETGELPLGRPAQLCAWLEEHELEARRR